LDPPAVGADTPPRHHATAYRQGRRGHRSHCSLHSATCHWGYPTSSIDGGSEHEAGGVGAACRPAHSRRKGARAPPRVASTHHLLMCLSSAACGIELRWTVDGVCHGRGRRAQSRPPPESRLGRFRACLARQLGHQKLLLLFMPTALACARGTKEQRGVSLVLPVAMAARLALQWHAAGAIASFGETILAFHLLLHTVKCS
jgi:hypothetical protein